MIIYITILFILFYFLITKKIKKNKSTFDLKLLDNIFNKFKCSFDKSFIENLKNELLNDIKNELNKPPKVIYPISLPQTEFFTKNENIFKSEYPNLTTYTLTIPGNNQIEYKEMIPKEKNTFHGIINKDYKKFSLFKGFYCKKCNTHLQYMQISETEFEYSCLLCGLKYKIEKHPQDLIINIHQQQISLR